MLGVADGLAPAGSDPAAGFRFERFALSLSRASDRGSGAGFPQRKSAALP
jgi:hypothetical protein